MRDVELVCCEFVDSCDWRAERDRKKPSGSTNACLSGSRKRLKSGVGSRGGMEAVELLDFSVGP